MDGTGGWDRWVGQVGGQVRVQVRGDRQGGQVGRGTGEW